MHVHAECPTVNRQDPCPHVADVAGDTNIEQNECTKCTVLLSAFNGDRAAERTAEEEDGERPAEKGAAKPGPAGGEHRAL